MTKSALQIARAAYQPKLPKALKGTVKAAEGAATQSVADQEEIKKLFPNTYGMPLIKFETTDEVVNFPAMNVGVFRWTGSWRSQCDFRHFRRYQEAEQRQQIVWLYSGSWRLG